MERRDSRGRREAEAWMATKAPTEPQDKRENKGNPAPQDHLPIRLILPWPKVSEATQDSQGVMGSQEAGAHQETPVHQAHLACLLETKVKGEACPARWDPKASLESRASLHVCGAHRVLMEYQVNKDPLGLLGHQDQMASCSA